MTVVDYLDKDSKTYNMPGSYTKSHNTAFQTEVTP